MLFRACVSVTLVVIYVLSLVLMNLCLLEILEYTVSMLKQ